jgi:hypothetical protein
MNAHLTLILVSSPFALVALIALINHWRDIESIQKIAPDSFDTKREIAALKAEFWKGFLGWISGLAVIVGFGFTWLQLTYTSRSVEVSQAAQLADRFSKATAQLGEKSKFSRLGGIYALEGIGVESEPYARPAVQSLSAYVRSSNRSSTKAPTLVTSKSFDTQKDELPSQDEITSAILAIGRISTTHRSLETIRPQFNDIDIENLTLTHSYLRHSNFERAKLRYAELTFNKLNNSKFIDSNLEQADLTCSDLSSTVMLGAVLRSTRLNFATLAGSDLTNADFTGADLDNADLRNTDIRQAKGISSSKRLINACIDVTTKLPSNLLGTGLSCRKDYIKAKKQTCRLP